MLETGTCCWSWWDSDDIAWLKHFRNAPSLAWTKCESHKHLGEHPRWVPVDLHSTIGVGWFWLSDRDSNSHRMWLWSIFMSASDLLNLIIYYMHCLGAICSWQLLNKCHWRSRILSTTCFHYRLVARLWGSSKSSLSPSCWLLLSSTKKNFDCAFQIKLDIFAVRAQRVGGSGTRSNSQTIALSLSAGRWLGVALPRTRRHLSYSPCQKPFS